MAHGAIATNVDPSDNPDEIDPRELLAALEDCPDMARYLRYSDEELDTLRERVTRMLTYN